MSQIILASQSPQRKLILSTLGIDFEIKPADIDEQAVPHSDLKTRAANIAIAKAKAIAKDYPQTIIIAADTYPVFGTKTLEKPRDLDEARQMLNTLSGKTFEAYTGWCYIDGNRKAEAGQIFEKSGVAVTTTTFRDLGDAEIEHYITTQPVTTWSAAFCPAYHEGAALVARVEGSMTGFTHGLALEELVPLLRESGVKV